MQSNLFIGAILSVIAIIFCSAADGLDFGDGIVASACIMGFMFVGGLFGGIDAYNPPKNNSSNLYKGMSVHQRNMHQKELDELNDQVEDLNDRFGE